MDRLLTFIIIFYYVLAPNRIAIYTTIQLYYDLNIAHLCQSDAGANLGLSAPKKFESSRSEVSPAPQPPIFGYVVELVILHMMGGDGVTRNQLCLRSYPKSSFTASKFSQIGRRQGAGTGTEGAEHGSQESGKSISATTFEDAIELVVVHLSRARNAASIF